MIQKDNRKHLWEEGDQWKTRVLMEIFSRISELVHTNIFPANLNNGKEHRGGVFPSSPHWAAQRLGGADGQQFIPLPALVSFPGPCLQAPEQAGYLSRSHHELPSCTWGNIIFPPPF